MPPIPIVGLNQCALDLPMNHNDDKPQSLQRLLEEPDYSRLKHRFIAHLFSSISLAIAFVLGTPLVFDRAKFRSLLAVAVYLTDSLTASLTA